MKAAAGLCSTSGIEDEEQEVEDEVFASA